MKKLACAQVWRDPQYQGVAQFLSLPLLCSAAEDMLPLEKADNWSHFIHSEAFAIYSCISEN